MRRLFLLLSLLPFIVETELALAESSSAELEKQVEVLHGDIRQLKQMLLEQQRQILELRGMRTPSANIGSVASSAKESAGKSVPSTDLTTAAQTIGSGPSLGRLANLPDIGLVGDIVGTTSKTLDDDEGNDRISVREVELVLGSDVDPYSRFDATITFSDLESPDVEEAYATYWGLPGEVKARIGRVHQRIGKASAMHRDSLDTVDEPLVVQQYLGAEGLFRTGIDFSGFLPWEGEEYVQQLTVGMMEGGVGEGGQLLADDPSRPSFYTHLSNYWDLSEVSNFELGGTYLLGSGAKDDYSAVNTFGIDATYNRHLNSMGKFKLQSEIFLTDRSDSSGENSDDEPVMFDRNAFGFYTLADYRLNKRWGFGGRYDLVEPIELDEESERSRDQALSGYLTFFQSEYARWRFQYQYAELVDGQDDNRFFVQSTFAIGSHKHQLQ